MKDLAQTPYDPLIEPLVRQVDRWKLALPAILVLETTRPLNFIASQGLLLFEPILRFFYQEPRIADYVEFFANRSNVDHLVASLRREYESHDGISKETGAWKT
ncbi:hypothetical protein ACFLUM_03975 [Chloroflexota bacterium]